MSLLPSPVTAPEPTPVPAPVQLPTDTTPTWEIELLISGALTFASYQLPGLLDGWFYAMQPKLPEALFTGAIMLYLFLKSVTIVLAITFSVHILLRGFWAAALGLHSVYPDGVLWDRLKMGPIFARISKAQTPTMSEFISRLDNRASVGFALGGLLLQLTLISGVGTLVIFVGTEVLARTTGLRLEPGLTFAVVGGVVLLPLLLAGEVDKKLGERLAPGTPMRRMVERLARVNSALNPTRFMGPMMLVFTSRLGQWRGTLALVVLIYIVFGIVLVQLLVSMGVWSLDGYRVLADQGRQVLQPAHYADQRATTDKYATMPFVPSETVTGGVLRVFVPYRIEAFDAALERTCPAALRIATAADTVAAAAGRDSSVACLGRLLAPAIDDQPLTDVRWFAGTDPSSGLRGLVGWVPVTTLADGPHVLSMMRLPRRRAADAAPRGAAPPTARYEIPFFIDRSLRDGPR